jgi:DNA-nicking Smr family endonuclease
MSRRPKGLSAEDRKLWTHVARSVKPLDPARMPPSEEVDPPPPEPEPALRAKKAAAARPVVAAPPPGPPPLATLEKGLKRKLSRGAVEVDAKIDLHGLTQEAAHRRLNAFLRRAQANGFRVVVVITGKGAPKRLRGLDDDPYRPDAYAERGVLRRVVPEWLALPDMRALVIGFEEAALAHGGAGALYVRIRRP